MKNLILITLFFVSLNHYGKTKTIHVFVALCDNLHQGIVPVPDKIGNGKDTKHNLYWGAGYGVKNFFDKKTSDWKLVKTLSTNDTLILERVLFKHKTEDVYLLADAYDGEFIKICTQKMIESANGQHPLTIPYKKQLLSFGGNSDLLAYIGHDGLMDFTIEPVFYKQNIKKREVIVLACYSEYYFIDEIIASGAEPLVLTTHLMAPEAYSLKAAIDGWIKNETDQEILERVAQAYHKYQKCGISGARRLFTSGKQTD